MDSFFNAVVDDLYGSDDWDGTFNHVGGVVHPPTPSTPAATETGLYAPSTPFYRGDYDFDAPLPAAAEWWLEHTMTPATTPLHEAPSRAAAPTAQGRIIDIADSSDDGDCDSVADVMPATTSALLRCAEHKREEESLFLLTLGMNLVELGLAHDIVPIVCNNGLVVDSVADVVTLLETPPVHNRAHTRAFTAAVEAAAASSISLATRLDYAVSRGRTKRPCSAARRGNPRAKRRLVFD